MQFQVLKENINKVISIIGRNISPRPQLPILSNILIKAEKGHLQLSVTNLELGIIFTIPAKIEKEGEITVPGKLLMEFIANLSADKIEFKLDGTNLTIKTEKTKATFATIPSSDFPPFPQIPEKKNKLQFNKIKNAISRTVYAASTDEGRPVLTGVRTILTSGKMTLSATDGYRLSIENITLPENKQDLKIILPATTLAEIVRIASDLKTEEMEFTIIESKNQAIFILGNCVIFTRLIEGEFPNIEKIIPQGGKTRVVVGRDELAQGVKTVSLFARGAANIIKIKVEKEGLRLSANTPQVGDDEDFIEAKVEGEEGEIAFNFRFLLDLLANFPEENLVFEMNGSLNPGVFKPESPTLQFLHIIMPVRIQG